MSSSDDITESLGTASTGKLSDAALAPLFAMVAGEASGDLLGAGLMAAIKAQYPHARFIGVGGPKMLAEGFETLADMERLSVMGLVEPLKRLPELFALRSRLVETFIAQRPAVFIGIDAPDFNLGLARKLKAAGIRSCHYVCPSVWAWRQGRVKKIRQSVDHILALLPFESAFLQQHAIDSTFVGHPLAEQLNIAGSVNAYLPSELSAQIEAFNTDASPLVCVMPGSRKSEVQALLDVFLQTVALCLAQNRQLRFIIPAATEELYQQLSMRLEQADVAEIRQRVLLVSGQSRYCMQACDLVLLASGTATLEAALLGKPMVVAYRMAALTYALASRMVKVDYVALPNLLTEQPMVPEFIQHEATPQALSQALFRYLDNPTLCEAVKQAFGIVHQQLAQNASERAAEVVLQLAQLSATGGTNLAEERA